MKVRTLLLSCLLWTASEGAEIDKLTQKVVENDFKLKSLMYHEKAYEYKIDQAKAGYKPKISVTSYFGWDKYRPYYLQRDISQNLGYYYLSISQPIYNPQVFPQIRQSKYYKDVASLKVMQEKSYVKYIFFDTLINYIITKENVDRYKQMVELAQEKLKLLTILYTEKKITQTDLSNGEIEYLNYSNQYANILSTLEYLKMVLTNLVGKESIVEIDNIGIQFNFPIDRFFVDIVDIERDIVNNFEIRIAQKNIDIAKEEIDIRRYKGYPRIDLEAIYLKSSTTSVSIAKHDQRINLNFNYPIYQGGYVKALVMEAQELLKVAEMDYNQTKKDNLQKIYDVYRDYKSAYRSIPELKLKVEESLRVYEKTKEGFKSKAATKIDMINSQLNLLKSEIDLRTTFYNYLSGYTKIRFLTGKTEFDIEDIFK